MKITKSILKFYILSLLFIQTGHALNFEYELRLTTFSNEGVTSIPLEQPFNILSDLSVRFNGFFEDTYLMNVEELHEYLQQPNYQRQRILEGVDTFRSSELYVLKRSIYQMYYLDEESFIQHAGEVIKKSTTSFEEKVIIIGSILKDMYDIYDMERVRGLGNAEILVTDFARSLNNRMQGNSYDRVGVCRDIHQSVLKIARKAGISEAFGISYISATAPHLNLIFTDPENP